LAIDGRAGKLDPGGRLRVSDSKHELALNEVVCAAAEASTLEGLASTAVPLLGRLLDARAVLYADPSGEGPTAFGGDAQLVGGFPEYAERFAAEDPTHAALAALEPPVAIGSRIPRYPEFRRRSDFEDFNTRVDTGFALHVRIGDAAHLQPGMAAIAFLRRLRLPDYQERDAAAVVAVVPALQSAVRRAGRARRAEEQRVALETLLDCADPRPLLAFDRQARLLWASPSAEALFAADRNPAHALPEVLLTAVHGLAAVTTGRSRGNHDYSPLSVPILLGQTSPFEANLRLERTSRGDTIVVVDLGAPEVPPGLAALAARHGLTPAEAEVLEALARGLANREISRRRFVSVATVRTHVGRILQKLGVRSRTQAALLARGVLPRRPHP
jgi:DNA-binding CsgD family transcriptional regulator